MPRGNKAPAARDAKQAATAPTVPDASSTTPMAAGSGTRSIQQWRVDALEPNPHNAHLFPDSLSCSQVELLAQDLATHGQGVPILITPTGKIVDGERRRRAAQSLGWEQVDVIVCDELTDDQILDRVIDACVSARQMSPREQANIYRAIVAALSKEVGTPQGRPARKKSPNGDPFVPAPELRKLAAAKARFSSAKLAERAEVVFRRASPDVQDRVCSGELTISAAYELVPKRERKVRPGPSAAGEAGGVEDSRDTSIPASSDVPDVLDNPFAPDAPPWVAAPKPRSVDAASFAAIVAPA
ncbi:MAG TPA: ParB/RepB/Spo0J family partition protein, partial [Polyangiaceae bacterium]|nr:ParB/RepB/Spo0J family partition protein [Polyangiaceae bacterium]